MQTGRRNEFRSRLFQQGIDPDTLLPDWYDPEYQPSELMSGCKLREIAGPLWEGNSRIFGA